MKSCVRVPGAIRPTLKNKTKNYSESHTKIAAYYPPHTPHKNIKL